jgi:hypothetical protein
MLPFCPEGKWRHGKRRTIFIGSGPGACRCVWAYGRMGVWRSQSADLSAEAFAPPQDFRRSALRRRKAWFRRALGRTPISVNLMGLRLYVEDLSRRDSVKVARYEVLGNDAKRHERPGRDDRKRPAFGLARRSAIANFGRSSRSSFVVLTSDFADLSAAFHRKLRLRRTRWRTSRDKSPHPYNPNP